MHAWMIELAWDHLHRRGWLTNAYLLSSDGLNVKQSSAVCALLARLPGVEVASTRPIELRFRQIASPRRGGRPLDVEGSEEAMPYESIADLPKSQVDQYSRHQKEVFLAAFNNALEEYGGDEHRAFAVAHAAAKKAERRD